MTDLEDKVGLLEYQLSESNKRIAKLEGDFPHIRDRFESYNSDVQEVKKIGGSLRNEYAEIRENYDIRLNTIDKKIQEILTLTIRNIEKQNPKVQAHRSL